MFYATYNTTESLRVKIYMHIFSISISKASIVK